MAPRLAPFPGGDAAQDVGDVAVDVLEPSQEVCVKPAARSLRRYLNQHRPVGFRPDLEQGADEVIPGKPLILIAPYHPDADGRELLDMLHAPVRERAIERRCRRASLIHTKRTEDEYSRTRNSQDDTEDLDLSLFSLIVRVTSLIVSAAFDFFPRNRIVSRPIPRPCHCPASCFLLSASVSLLPALLTYPLRSPPLVYIAPLDPQPAQGLARRSTRCVYSIATIKRARLRLV
eukprot:653374-Hanusia_phi.AAC.2